MTGHVTLLNLSFLLCQRDKYDTSRAKILSTQPPAARDITKTDCRSFFFISWATFVSKYIANKRAKGSGKCVVTCEMTRFSDLNLPRQRWLFKTRIKACAAADVMFLLFSYGCCLVSSLCQYMRKQIGNVFFHGFLSCVCVPGDSVSDWTVVSSATRARIVSLSPSILFYLTILAPLVDPSLVETSRLGFCDVFCRVNVMKDWSPSNFLQPRKNSFLSSSLILWEENRPSYLFEGGNAILGWLLSLSLSSSLSISKIGQLFFPTHQGLVSLEIRIFKRRWFSNWLPVR